MSRAEDFLLTAEERRIRRRRRRRLVFIAVASAFLLALAVLCARPARNTIKSWQARRHAEKAFRLIDGEKWLEAREEAVAAYQLRPNEPEALRAVARLLSRTRQSQALEFWEQLAKQQPLTRDDQRDRAAVALTSGDIPAAETAVRALLREENGGPQPADWLLAAQLALNKTAGDEAIRSLEKIFADRTATERQLFQASLLQINAAGSVGRSDAEETQAAAWARLTKLAQGQSATALDALTILAQRALSSSSSSSPSFLTTALEHHPLAKAPHKLLAIDLRIHAEPQRKVDLVNEAIATWKNAADEALIALAKWLNGKGEFQRELDTIPLQRALQNRDLFLQHVDALGALGHWEEIRRLLESERFPLDRMTQHMYLARCYAQLGQKVASENNWQRALEQAASDPGHLILLAEYAEKNAATGIATSAYDNLIRVAPRSRLAWQGKLRMAQAGRDTRAIHAVLQLMLKLWPNETALQRDEAYLRLLLLGDRGQKREDRGQNPAARDPGPIPSSELRPLPSELSAIEQLAEDLVRREPRSLPHRTLLALARLRANRPYTALEAYQGIEIPAYAATVSALAVHAAVLQATGDPESATAEANQIRRADLLPEERALIENL